MDVKGEYRIAVPREKVWAALNDPEVLAKCSPGCKELRQESPSEMAAKVALKVGPVSATFSGSVKLEDIDAPRGYTLVGQGNGGMAGFAKGKAVVSLAALLAASFFSPFYMAEPIRRVASSRTSSGS